MAGVIVTYMIGRALTDEEIERLHKALSSTVFTGATVTNALCACGNLECMSEPIGYIHATTLLSDPENGADAVLGVLRAILSGPRGVILRSSLLRVIDR